METVKIELSTALINHIAATCGYDGTLQAAGESKKDYIASLLMNHLIQMTGAKSEEFKAASNSHVRLLK